MTNLHKNVAPGWHECDFVVIRRWICQHKKISLVEFPPETSQSSQRLFSIWQRFTQCSLHYKYLTILQDQRNIFISQINLYIISRDSVWDKFLLRDEEKTTSKGKFPFKLENYPSWCKIDGKTFSSRLTTFIKIFFSC